MTSFPSSAAALAPPLHPRSLVLANHKGGVGKTSSATALAGLFALAGYRVLICELDAQGNARRDFGIYGTDLDDDGWNLVAAIHGGKPLEPVQVRTNIDFVVSGSRAEVLAVQTGRLEDNLLGLRRAIHALEARVGDYDIVIIDTPPGQSHVRRMAISAARWVIVPTKPDDGSLDGVAGIANDFEQVYNVNPDVELLGVLLFAIGSGSKNVRKEVRAKLEAGLGDPDLIFEEIIPGLEAPATNARNKGQLVYEYATELLSAPTYLERKTAKSAQTLAAHQERLANEVIRRMENRLEAEEHA